MYSGSLLALIDVPPRMRICAQAPGSPLFCVIWTPVARPSIRFVTLTGTAVWTLAASMVATDPVIASRRWVPYPVVTTSCRTAAWRSREKITLTAPPLGTATTCTGALNPIRRARTVCEPEGTPPMVKVPSGPDTAPRLVPSTKTLTSATGCWVVASTTLPVMVPVGGTGFWALSRAVHNRPTTSARMRRRTAAIRRSSTG